MFRAKALGLQGPKGGCIKSCTSALLKILSAANKAILELATECIKICTDKGGADQIFIIRLSYA
ncbi:hypothetical protein GAB14E_0045 [Colwellia psychrerythraea]|uniref:Uncharacterized protein n=1 Tax=Colwellia psychrerythraea TaxID=28229 RepID=A0A099L2N5_COLPS|nr:hypothetical protein GAB14E_0045 [Colwellia psychrerythraea]